VVKRLKELEQRTLGGRGIVVRSDVVLGGCGV
jgi:hypothetical protein